LPQAHIMGGILFLSYDRVIISGNFRTGNSASNWTLSFSSNNLDFFFLFGPYDQGFSLRSDVHIRFGHV